jgi:AsmA protein
VRIGRWIIGIAAGLALLAVVTVLVVTVFVDPNRYRGQIERAVTQATGQPFKIVGDLSISWYPWLALRMGPAQFGKPGGPDAKPIVQWQSARVGAKLIPLTQGELIINGIRLDSPQFFLRRDAAGHANWDDVVQRFKNRPRSPATGPNTTPGPQIGGFEIRDGTLSFADERSGKRFTITSWLLDVGEWKAGATFPVETRLVFRKETAASEKPVPGAKSAPGAKAATGTRASESPPLEVELRVSGRVHVSDDANDIDIFGLDSSSRLRGGTLPAQGVPVNLQVSRLAARLSPLDVAISELSGNIADAHLTAAIQAGETGPDKALYVRGPLSLQIRSVRDLLSAFGIKAPLPLDTGTFGVMKLTSTWEWNDGAVTVNDIDLALDETRFNGHFTRSADDEALWTFALHGDKIGLSRYVAIEDISKEPFELPVAALRALKMQGELTFDQAWLADAQMQNVRLRLELADGAIRKSTQ